MLPFTLSDSKQQQTHRLKQHLLMTSRKTYLYICHLHGLLTLALQLASNEANQSDRLTLRGVSHYPNVPFDIARFTGPLSQTYGCLTLPLTLKLRSTTDTVTLASQFVIQMSSLLFLLSQEINTTLATADFAVSGSC